MIYAVIDTNVLVSARITKNSSSATVKVLNNMFNGTIKPVFNDEIIAEYTLICVTVQACQAISLQVRHLSAVNGIANMYRKKTPDTFHACSEEIAARTLFPFLMGSVAICQPEPTVCIIRQQS